MCFIVGRNEPGYLPEAPTVTVCGDLGEAIEQLIEDMNVWADDVDTATEQDLHSMGVVPGEDDISCEAQAGAVAQDLRTAFDLRSAPLTVTLEDNDGDLQSFFIHDSEGEHEVEGAPNHGRIRMAN